MSTNNKRNNTFDMKTIYKLNNLSMSNNLGVTINHVQDSDEEIKKKILLIAYFYDKKFSAITGKKTLDPSINITINDYTENKNKIISSGIIEHSGNIGSTEGNNGIHYVSSFVPTSCNTFSGLFVP